MRLVDEYKKLVFPSADYKFKEFVIDGVLLDLFFNETLASTNSINDLVLKRLVLLKKKDLKHLESKIPGVNIIKINKDEIMYLVNLGFLVIFNKNNLLAVEVRAYVDRGVNQAQGELSLLGPKDSFNENYNTNVALLRRRIKTSDFKILSFEIGRISKTKIGICYIEGIVKDELVLEIENKLKKIDIDGIIDISYLKNTIEIHNNFLPSVMITERPDKVSMALLEGKVGIMADLSPYMLIVPSFFTDFFHTVDDYYQKSSNVTFSRLLRLLAFFIAIFIPGIYLAITTRNYNLVPLDLLYVLMAGRSFVPFPAYIEALILIFAFEILKESDIRMSSVTGSAVSILGGLILGDAAVSAGIVSPIMIIVIAISSIAGLVFNSLELVNTTRIYKILILLLGAFLGIYGVFLGFIFILYNICSMKIFNIPYFSPIIPFIKDDILDSFILKNKKYKTRNPLISKNKNRGRYT